jgi:hypothetical protein
VRSCLRLLRSWADKAMLLALVAATAIGLAWLDSRVIRPGRGLEPQDDPRSGVTVRNEVLHLWLPETLSELAKHQPFTAVAQQHQQLRTSLERRARESAWYALTTRAHQANGGMADITYIRHPYSDSQTFQELLDVLATAAGNPPLHSTLNLSGARVHILSSELSEREPSEVVRELLRGQLMSSQPSRE